MDPQASLNELLESLKSRDWDRVEETATAILDWMDNGGIPPQTLGAKKLGKTWRTAITRFTCHYALSKLRDAQKRKREHP